MDAMLFYITGGGTPLPPTLSKRGQIDLKNGDRCHQTFIHVAENPERIFMLSNEGGVAGRPPPTFTGPGNPFMRGHAEARRFFKF